MATAGFYYFKKGSDFYYAAMDMIYKDDLNGVFYICPVFNQLILNQKCIGVFQIQQDSYISFMSVQFLEDYSKILLKKP